MLSRTLLLSALSLWLPLSHAAWPDEVDERLAGDVKFLQAAGVATDGPGLLEFFRQKTLSADQRRQIDELIEQLGSKDFKVREKANKQLIALGQAAVPALEQALQQAELEVVARIQLCLKARKGQPPTELLAAAVRVLTARKPPEAVEVLLAFLPDAGDLDVEDEIVRALAVVGVRDGKADPALVQALSDKLPLRRAAAGAALGRIDLPEHKTAVRKLLQDPEPVIRLHVALALVFAREKEAVTVLIDLLPKLPQRRDLQVEDILYQLAEGHARPAITLGSGAAGRKKCRDAWAAWWKDHAAKVDLARLQEMPGGWVSLFNHKDLTGWKTHPNAPGDWRVEDGILIGRGPKINHLYTERGDYVDFHFRIVAKINAGGNSGQNFRKHFSSKIGDGYEAQIDSSSHRAKTGSLYITTSPAVAIEKVLVPVDTWFTQEVIVRGNHIVILVNGQKTVDFVDNNNTYPRGHLALQVYDPPTVVHFRRIEVKELGWMPVFKNKELAGFDGLPGAWRFDKGVLAGTPPAMPKTHATFLCSQKKFRDFELRFRVKLEEGLGGSGVIIRGMPAGNFLPWGPLVKVGDDWGGWGHLTWEQNGKPQIPMPLEMRNAVAKLINKDGFNNYFIKCAGKHVTVQVNGFTTVDQIWQPLPEEGIIAFQIHYGKGTKGVQFRNVEIKELQSAGAPITP